MAATGSFWFQTPSHNIACVGDAKSIRCDTRFVTKYAQPRYKPRHCDVDWGPLGMGPLGRAGVLCVGDTALNAKAKVLGYGQSKLFGACFRCTSRTSGLRCKPLRPRFLPLARETVDLLGALRGPGL